MCNDRPENSLPVFLSPYHSLSLYLSDYPHTMFTRDLETLLDEREDEGYCSRLISELNGDLDSTSCFLKEDLVILTILCICTDYINILCVMFRARSSVYNLP